MFRVLSALAFVVVATQARAQSPASTDTAAVRASVLRFNGAMEAAFARGDMKTFSANFADDAIIRSAHAIGAAGRTAIDGFFGGVPSPKSFKIESYGVSSQGDVVYQTGKATSTFGAPEQRTTSFQFLMVLRRQPGDTFRIQLYYYHVVEPG
jgi:ketosteroid isomerase-like protein